MTKDLKWLGKFTFTELKTLGLIFALIIMLLIIFRWLGKWIAYRKEQKQLKKDIEKQIETSGVTGQYTIESGFYHKFPQKLGVEDLQDFRRELKAMIKQARSVNNAGKRLILDFTETDRVNSNGAVGIIEAIKNVYENNVISFDLLYKKENRKAFSEIESMAKIYKSNSIEIKKVDK